MEFTYLTFLNRTEQKVPTELTDAVKRFSAKQHLSVNTNT